MKQLTKTIALDILRTEQGIKLVKDSFERALAKQLDLQRVSAPRFLPVGTGLQDDLAGLQTPVSFTTKARPEKIEVVHSLAKWKRHALHTYGFAQGTGIYTDMDAIRKDEDVDDIHSIYVDQWDWEKVLAAEERTLPYLKETVKKIFAAMKTTEAKVHEKFPHLIPRLPEKITFVHSEELEEKYPSLAPKEREHEAAKEHGALFLIGIGHPLASGKPHDARATDYDDWITETSPGKHGLDGDIIVWDSLREQSLELSSMGIRVDKEALLKQVKMMHEEDKLELPFHKGIADDILPLTMGGGIGQSRLCMFFLHKKHIGEVQCGIWPEQMHEELAQKGVFLL